MNINNGGDNMSQVKNLEELNCLSEKYKNLVSARRIKKLSDDLSERHIMVCQGTGCMSSKSDEIMDKLKSNIEKYGLEDSVKVVLAGCFGFCAKGPIVHICQITFFIYM